MAEDIKARIVFDTSGLGAIGAAVGTPASSGGSTGGSGGGMVGSLMGGLTKMALPIMAIKDIASAIMKGISFIAESSNMLKSVMGGIMKMLKLILKPIGDIFAIVLMPVLSIMRMVGLFFQVIMRPYIRKAMALVAVGNAQMGAGNITEGLEAFDLAATFMFTGFA